MISQKKFSAKEADEATKKIADLALLADGQRNLLATREATGKGFDLRSYNGLRIIEKALDRAIVNAWELELGGAKEAL